MLKLCFVVRRSSRTGCVLVEVVDGQCLGISHVVTSLGWLSSKLVGVRNQFFSGSNADTRYLGFANQVGVAYAQQVGNQTDECYDGFGIRCWKGLQMDTASLESSRTHNDLWCCVAVVVVLDERSHC